jgi:hypothetical protein
VRQRFRALTHSPIVYPLLFAAYPVVFLWAQNRDNAIPTGGVLTVLAVVLALTVILFGMLRVALHDTARAALATSLIVLLMLTAGRLAGLLRVGTGTVESDGLIIAFALICVTAVLLAKGVRKPERLAGPLNLVAFVLVAMNLIPIAPSLGNSGTSEATARWQIPPGAVQTPTGPARDVYYLIFDRYGGSRTLRDLYGYDDSGFLQSLRAKGLAVVDDARANYPQTTHSLASSLNMTTLDDLAAAVGADSHDRAPLQRSFVDPTVAQAFESIGYRYEHVGSWWGVTWVDPTADTNYVYGGVPEFARVFLDTTIEPMLAQTLHLEAVTFDRQAYDRVAYQAEVVADIADNPEPTFTFAHFLLPHPPYIFAADGSFIPPGSSQRSREDAYIEQLRYCNELILSLIDRIRAAPGPAPIIIVQSDEGPHPPQLDTPYELETPWTDVSDVELGRKLRILNAYFLPGLGRDPIYPGITPVNTFRVILNAYFGGSFPLLPDRTYVFTDYRHPYRFEDVTDRLT